MRRTRYAAFLVPALLFQFFPARGLAQSGFYGGLFGQTQPQSGGAVRGTIKLADGGTPLHNVIVNLVQLKRSTETDENGAYEFQNIPPGTYTILAHMEGFPDTDAAGARDVRRRGDARLPNAPLPDFMRRSRSPRPAASSRSSSRSSP